MFEKVSRAAKIKSRSGWSNFSTLVGHIFEKLFEFARLNRIKTLIFVSKSGCSLKKKKVFTWNRSAKFLFSRKIIAFSKKTCGCLSSTRLVQNCCAGQGLDHTVLHCKKKKGLHLYLLSNFPTFVQKLGCSLKKSVVTSLLLETMQNNICQNNLNEMLK